ncbi:flagellar basal-body rod protein FlgG [Clostridium omnivorum]|uniref:Flagellar basal body protein n=1 Tax=Clostridium omnivorum TaxID=1604902 RepID=A0ABQ5NAZ5_9CLOT|nr:flagellar basal-body rod protein FlgG [Clostridium sp. E14]GLC32372.1 flagellar basal body protein [Clostridium sp. E14]
MLRILWNSRAGMNAQQEKLDSISNNLANVNTEGYKKTDVTFSDLVQETLNRQGYPNTKGSISSTGTGVKASQWIRDGKQGNLLQTGSNTDLAIDGSGYFAVTTADGTVAYTRNGSFNTDSAGSIVDKNGNRLNITFNPGATNEDRVFTQDNFVVSPEGIVSKRLPGGNTKEVGKIELYNFVGQDSLRSVGENLYVPKAGTQMYQNNDYNIEQGFLEGSNVDVASEMTDMIVTQRAFELSSKGLKTADDMWGITNNLRSK